MANDVGIRAVGGNVDFSFKSMKNRTVIRFYGLVRYAPVSILIALVACVAFFYVCDSEARLLYARDAGDTCVVRYCGHTGRASTSKRRDVEGGKREKRLGESFRNDTVTNDAIS